MINKTIVNQQSNKQLFQGCGGTIFIEFISFIYKFIASWRIGCFGAQVSIIIQTDGREKVIQKFFDSFKNIKQCDQIIPKSIIKASTHFPFQYYQNIRTPDSPSVSSIQNKTQQNQKEQSKASQEENLLEDSQIQKSSENFYSALTQFQKEITSTTLCFLTTPYQLHPDSSPTSQKLIYFIEDELMSLAKSQRRQLLTFLKSNKFFKAHLQKIYAIVSPGMIKDLLVLAYLIFKRYSENHHQPQSMNEMLKMTNYNQFLELFSHCLLSELKICPFSNDLHPQINRLRDLSVDLARKFTRYILAVIFYSRKYGFQKNFHYQDDPQLNESEARK